MPIDPYIGQIIAFAGTMKSIKGFLPCNGQALQISQYSALFSLLGTTYGGNGTSTFNLPNLNGRTIVGCAPADRGQIGGVETVTLDANSMPRHTHAFVGFAEDATTNRQTNALYASITLRPLPPTPPPPAQPTTVPTPFGAPTNLVPLDPNMLTPMFGRPAGGVDSHDNMQPFLVLKYFIAVNGLYPPRSDS